MRLLTIGTFDVPHAGHASFLAKCARITEDITVGVLHDEFVERVKGKPVFGVDDRMWHVELMGYFAVAVRSDNYLHPDLVRSMRPDILAVGSDWADKPYVTTRLGMTHTELAEQETALVYIPYTRGISTTSIIDRVTNHADRSGRGQQETAPGQGTPLHTNPGRTSDPKGHTAVPILFDSEGPFERCSLCGRSG